MTKETHPIISVYGNTQFKYFPIILVIGREPNCSAKFINQIGEYDFDKYPNCAFWNISYATIGEAINKELNSKNLKNKFRSKGSSFIAYTDLCPQPILAKQKGKKEIKNNIGLEVYEKHINDILSHEDIIKRVDLIILSGLDKNNVKPESLVLLKEKLTEKNKKFIEVPFFYGNNKNKIKERIDKEKNIKNIIRGIYEKWEDN